MIVRVSPLPSVSLASTGTAVAAASSLTVAVSFTASGAVLLIVTWTVPVSTPPLPSLIV